MPFANLSQEKSNEPFTSGIHDDVLTQLAKVGALTVISGTSVRRLDRSMSIPQISAILRVESVLEGSVQRVGDRVRINVQLINASDEHMWAETYDRELTAANIFAIQSEIARAVTGALQATLSTQQLADIEARPTESFAAYEAYLLGRQQLRQRTSETLFEAQRYFEKAIAIDPGYARAYAGLADTLLLQPEYSGVSQEEAGNNAITAIDTALELDDRLGEAQVALALYKSLWQNDFTGAETAVRRAIELSPNYPEAYRSYGMLLNRLGRLEEGLYNYRRALELDPLSPSTRLLLTEILTNLERHDEANESYRKLIEVAPDFPRGFFSKGMLEWFAFGRLDLAVPLMEQSVAMDPGDPNMLTFLGGLFLDLGDEATGARWIERAEKVALGSLWANVGIAWLHLYRGETSEAVALSHQTARIWSRWYPSLALLRDDHVAAGRYQQAIDTYRQGYPELFDTHTPLVLEPTNYHAAIDLAPVLIEVGDDERANELLDQSLAFVRDWPRMGGYGHLISDVEIYAIKGDTQTALDALRSAIDDGWRATWWLRLERNSNLAGLRDEPEFQRMLGDLRADMAEQLEKVRANDQSP